VILASLFLCHKIKYRTPKMKRLNCQSGCAPEVHETNITPTMQLTGSVSLKHLKKKVNGILTSLYKGSQIDCQLHPMGDEFVLVMIGDGVCATLHIQELGNALTEEGGEQ